MCKKKTHPCFFVFLIVLFLFSFSKFTHSTNFENTDNQPRTHSTLLSHGICGPECLRTSLFITLHFLIVKKNFFVFLLMRQGFCNTQHAFDYRSRAIWIIDPRTRVPPEPPSPSMFLLFWLVFFFGGKLVSLLLTTRRRFREFPLIL